MMRIIFSLLLFVSFFGQTAAQSTAFVFNGGLSIGFQKWDNSFDRQPLYKYHAALAIESVNNEADNGSIFMQFGYHIRGSATRFRFFYQGGGIQTYSEEFQFRNLSLLLGGKQKFPFRSKSKYFYYGGIRGDYTLSTNIDDLAGSNDPYTAIYYPFVGSMKRWMVGVSAGGGIEFPFNELVGGQLTLSVHPDFTYQYDQPSLGNIRNPYDPTGGSTIVIPERRIRNITFELSLGLRLLKKVVYEE